MGYWCNRNLKTTAFTPSTNNRMHQQINLALAVLFLILLRPAAAYSRYTIQWADKPAIHALTDSQKRQSAVFIQEEKVVELAEEDKEYKLYRTVHHIIHLNDEKAVEAY